MYTNLFNPPRSKEPTWEDLLDRQSKQKDYRRDKRSFVSTNNPKKSNDISKQENKNKKIVDLQKEFEELKNKIRHVENKNERMMTQLRTHNQQQEPIQDRSQPLLRDNVSKGRISKESLGKPVRKMEKSLNNGAFQNEFLPQLTVTSQIDKRSKNDLKYIVDAALSLKKKQQSFEKLINSKLRQLADRIVQTQQLSKLCTDFQTLKDNSAIEEKQSSQIFSMKSKQLELIINQLQRDKNKLKNQNRQLRLEIEDQKSKYQLHKDSFHKQIEELRLNSIKKLSQSESKYQKLIMKHHQEIQQARRESIPVLDTSRIWRQDQQKITKDNEVEMLKYQQQHLNGMIQQLRSQLEHEKSRIITVTNQKDKAQFELQKLQLSYSVEDYNQQLSNYKSENQTMLSQLKSIRRDKEQLETEISTLRRENRQYLLKINKKDEFRIQIQETYKNKLKEENKLMNNIREQKRRLEMENMQLKSFNKNLLSEKEKFGNDIVNEIKRILDIEGDAVIKTILENYISNPHILALEVTRIITQRKITQDQFRKKLIERGIVSDKDYNQGAKIQFFAIEHLWDQNRRLLREVEEKTERLKTKEQEWQGQRELIQSNGMKLKRTLEEVRKSHEEELKNKNLQIQPFREEQNNKFNEMRTIILKSQSDKKQLQNKIKMLEIEQSNLNEIKQNLTKKKQKSELEKQQIKVSLQKQISIKQQKIKKLETDLRENKEEYSRKKTEFTVENKRLEFNLSEMEIKIQKVNGEIEQKQIILSQKEEELKKKKEDTTGLQNQFKQVTKKLLQAENKVKVQEQQLRDKIAETLGLNSNIQQLNTKLNGLQSDIKQKSNTMLKQKLKIQEQKNSNQGTIDTMNENMRLLTKRLEDKSREMQHIEQKFQQCIQQKNQLQLTVEEHKLAAKQQQNEIDILNNKIKQYKKEIEQKDDAIKASIEQQNTYTYNLQEIKDFNTKKINKLESRVKELQDKNKILSQNKQAADKQLQNIKYSKQQQSDKISLQVQEISLKNIEIEKKLKAKQSQLQSREKQVEDKYKQVLYQTTKLQAQKSKSQQLQTRLTLKQKQLQQKQTDIKTKQDEVQLMKQQMKLKSILGESSLENSKAKTLQIQPFKEDLKKSSFNLEGYDVSDNFEIGEVQSKREESPNSAIVQFFLRVKTEIEKILYGQQISVEIFEVIPIEIETQFQELLNVISNKVNDNQLSFIYIDQFNADTMLGDSIMQQFPEINKEVVSLKRRVSEQEKIIADLTSEKGHHQLTINQMTQQMQEIEEENQARFIGQLSILKQELKESKLKIDNLEMIVETTKKSLFKVLDILVSDEEGEEENLLETINYYNNVIKAHQKEKKQLVSYFDRYVQKIR